MEGFQLLDVTKIQIFKSSNIQNSFQRFFEIEIFKVYLSNPFRKRINSTTTQQYQIDKEFENSISQRILLTKNNL